MPRGIDAVKKIVGRKRGIVTDTLGLLLAVTVLAASVTENAAGMQPVSQARAAHPQVARAWADSGFKNKAVEHAAALGVTMEIVARKSDEPIPRGKAPLGRRAGHRLAHAAPAPRTRLRGHPRILPGHDQPRHDRQHHETDNRREHPDLARLARTRPHHTIN